jgi:hypothetical protein
MCLTLAVQTLPFQARFILWLTTIWCCKMPQLNLEMPTDGPRQTLFKRFLAVTVIVWPTLGIYFLINRSISEATSVSMPSWVPFWPLMTFPYFGMLIATWFLPLAIRDGSRFRGCLLILVFSYVVTMGLWLVFRNTLVRPELPGGFWAGPYRWLATIDRPGNVTPCAHGIGPMVAAWFVARDRPGWRWPLLIGLGIGLSAVALTWQHRPGDILLGLLAPIIGIAVYEYKSGLKGTMGRVPLSPAGSGEP